MHIQTKAIHDGLSSRLALDVRVRCVHVGSLPYAGAREGLGTSMATHEVALLQSVITTLLLWPVILCRQVPAASGPDDSLPQPVPWQLPWAPVNLSTCLHQVLGLGAIKGGTTSLNHYIRQGLHPQLAVPDHKELNYWNHNHNFTDSRASSYHLHKYLASWHADLQKSDDPIGTLESQCNASRNQLVRLEVSCSKRFQCHQTST